MARFPNPRTSRIVLIGTDDLRINLADLRYALTESDGSVFPPEACTVLTEPNPAVLEVGLRVAADRAEDVLLVYYAGGVEIDALGEPHLTLQMSTIQGIMEGSRARARMLIIDCHAEGEFRAARFEVGGTNVLVSKEGDATSLTGELIRQLSGRGPALMFGELCQNLRRLGAEIIGDHRAAGGDVILRKRVALAGMENQIAGDVGGNAIQVGYINGDVHVGPTLPPVPPVGYNSTRDTLVITACILTILGVALLGFGIFVPVPALSYVGGAALLSVGWCLWRLWQHTAPVRQDRKRVRALDA